MSLGNSIFRKLLLSAILLIFASLLIMDFYLTRYTADRQRDAVEQRLAGQARVLAGEIPGSGGGPLEAWAKAAGARAQARITIIDRAGTVLADSERDPESMENHLNRPEIRQALTRHIGTAIRHSATLNRDMCYVAYPIAVEGRSISVLRLAVPLEELDTAIAEVRRRIFLVSLLAAVAALVIAYYFSRRFSRRIRRLQEFAESLPEGRFSRALLKEGDDELGALAESLHRMSMQIGDLVDRLSLESARLEAILASMVEGVLAVDQDLRVMFCNNSFARAVGAQAPFAEQQPLREVVSDVALFEMIAEVLQSGEPQKKRLQLSAGEGRAFEAQVTRLLTPSRRGAIAILHDITDIERLERVRKDFVANVSHELRTPLTAIQGYAETLLDGALEDQENNRKFLEIIRAHSIRLNNIASDLLVLSDLESGRPAPEPERVDLRSAVESALRTVESEANVRGVKLRCGDLQDMEVMGYRIRLEQALVNLLDNAVKFNRPGGEVRIDAARENGNAHVVISDTGIGIPPEDLSRIFERFYRVDKARSRQVGGTGLGLSIVKHVIERMHGNITVESHLGSGSSFTIVLPGA
jgi:two-component system, OmpR family, phosphate regulon sensor histidine kinase PhoR